MGQKMPVAQISLKGLPTTPVWYTVVTKFNYEQKFAHDLMVGAKNHGMVNNIIDVLVPIKEEEVVKELKSGKKKIVTKNEKLYPNYVFVKAIMNDDVWNYMRNTPGVSTILAPSGYPQIVSEKDIKTIKDICGITIKEEINRKEAIKNNINNIRNEYIAGRKVKITSSMFYGYEGTIVKVDFDKNKANVELDLNSINIVVDLNDVKPVA